MLPVHKNIFNIPAEKEKKAGSIYKEKSIPYSRKFLDTLAERLRRLNNNR